MSNIIITEISIINSTIKIGYTTGGSPPAPGPTPPGGWICNPSNGCNVNTECCQSYINQQSECDACVAESPPTPAPFGKKYHTL